MIVDDEVSFAGANEAECNYGGFEFEYKRPAQFDGERGAMKSWEAGFREFPLQTFPLKGNRPVMDAEMHGSD